VETASTRNGSLAKWRFERSRWRGGRCRVYKQAYLRLKEEELRRTIISVNAWSRILRNITNKAFRTTSFFAMTSSSKSIEFP
jgi:hypothetical protein